MGAVLSEIIKPVIKKRAEQYRIGEIHTLINMNEKIKDDCSDAALIKLLSDNEKYKDTVEHCMRDRVGRHVEA